MTRTTLAILLTLATILAAVLVRSPSGGAFMLTVISTGGGPKVQVTSDALPDGVAITPVPTSGGGMMGAGIKLSGWVGAISAVAWGMGAVSDVHATVFGNAGDALVSSSSGVKTFMATEGDFRGTLNAQVTTGYAKPGVFVGDVSKNVTGTLVGQYFAISETNLSG